MPVAKIETKFEPRTLKANRRNEAVMNVTVTADSGHKSYWCEFEIGVKPPLSLAHDKELNRGRTMGGILKQSHKIQKQVKLFTRPNNYPDDYAINITAYLYDEDGAIAERMVHVENIKCEE